MSEKLCITCADDEEGYCRCDKCGKSKSLWKAHPAYEVGKIEGRRAGLEAAWEAVKTKQGDSDAEIKIRALLEAK